MNRVKKKEIFDYLLGKFELNQEDDFLARCFSSDESAEDFEMVRDDLIELYLRGNLSIEDKFLFESNFLADPFNFELYEFSSMIRDYLKQHPPQN